MSLHCRYGAILVLLLWLAGGLWACEGAPPGELIRAPSLRPLSPPGDPGSFGVGLTSWLVQARVSDGFQVDVYYPANAATGGLTAGSLALEKAPYPLVILLHGGAVVPRRYGWMAQHIASRGYVVMMPHHLGQLAVFESDNTSYALAALYREMARRESPLRGGAAKDGPIAIIGHSLGGVVGTWQWLRLKQVTGLVLLGAWPADGTPVEQRAGSPVLSLVGQQDKRAKPERVKEGWLTFSQPRTMGVIQGMNHFDWTDNATEGELATDGVGALQPAEIRRNALRLLDTWLKATLYKDPVAAAALKAGVFEGVSLE